ncbi:hypothetical protein R50073_29580 [Maricurvus nonylphenolicus]|uniref:coiled-coil domain-containing protein n=1 Tax=Maricurvus nonylphenolicus TaxID=1008307 RepID=UPI0036F1EFF9
MGLFSRSHSKDEVITDPFEPVPLPDASDLDESFLADDDFDPAEIAAPEAPVKKLSYGIEDAISLMRTLPADNKELVVTVVKKTLESTQIALEEIIDDAKSKEQRLRDRTQQLQTEIKNLQQDIETRTKEITSLKADLKETLSVKEKLELAQKLEGRNATAKTEAQQKTPVPDKSAEETKAQPATTKPAAQASAKSESPAKPNTSAKPDEQGSLH